MNKPFLLTLILVITGSLTKAQDKKPITHESMWLMMRVGSPSISPDGKKVIFSVTEPTYDEKEQVNDVWIVSTDASSQPRKLTTGKAGENGYAWSPDGKYIAFSAKREGDDQAQIYLLNIQEGGEAQRLTSVSTGAASPQWSPDGKMVLFTSSVYPRVYVDSVNKKMDEEKKNLKYKARVYNSFPIRSWDRWLDEKQTHAFVQSIEQGGAARDIFSDVAISKEDGFHFFNACWTPDNNSVIFAASADFNTSARQEISSHLYKVPIAGGDASRLTVDAFDYTSPQFSPDGKYLFAEGSVHGAYTIYSLNHLIRWDWPALSNRKNLTPSIDRPIDGVAFQNDRILLAIQDQGIQRIISMNFDGSAIANVTQSPSGCYTGISTNDSPTPTLMASYQTANMPPEIVRINNDGSHTFLTRFNEDALASLDLQPVETFWTTSSRGKKIRSLLIKPAGFDPGKKYPLIVLMHGGPAGSWQENWGYRWNYHLLASPGYVMVLTDYTGSTGYSEKFSRDIQYDPFKGPANEINEAAAEAIKKFSFIDGSKQAAVGASYGGHLANWMQATTTHYKCLVSHAGLVNSVSQWGTSDGIYGREVMNGGAPWKETKTWKEQNPYRYADKFQTPMLITVGELDYRVPLNNSIENWHILQRKKIPGKLIVFPEENHWITKAEDSRFYYKELHAWLNQYLK